MFDGAGRLVCEPDLAAAQALCILQVHDIVVIEKNMAWGSRYHGNVSVAFYCNYDTNQKKQISPFNSLKASESIVLNTQH